MQKHCESFSFSTNTSRVFQITVLCQVSAFSLLEAVLGGEMPPRMISKVFGKYLYLLGPQTTKLISMMDN